jgi:hypothetical protein
MRVARVKVVEDRSPGGTPVGLLVLVACVAGATGPVAAASSDAPPLAVVALVLSAEGGAATDALAGAVQAQVSDLPVRLVIERLITFPPTLPAQVAMAAEIAARLAAGTVFWLDVSVPDRVFVFLAEPGGSRVLVRAVDAIDEAERVESVAVIVRGLAQAVLDGGTIGIAPPAPPPPEPPAASLPAEPAVVPPPPPAPARAWLGLQLAYEADFFTDQVSALHGLAAGLVFHLHENWSVFAAYRILGPAEVSGGGIDLDVSRHPMELGARFRWPLGDWDVGASLYGVVDYLTRDAGTGSSGMQVTAPEGAWLGGLGLLVHGSYRIAGSFRMFLDAGIDVFVNGVEYVVDTGAGRTMLLGSWYVCPRVLLGLSVDLV